jgi:cobyric acid synthase
MIQATGFGTSAGKSLTVALLSRLFSEAGYKVAPYKTVNMIPVTYIAQGKEFLKGAFMQMFGLKTEYQEIKQAATRSLQSLSKEYDIICIEGSGPAKLFGFGILRELHE